MTHLLSAYLCLLAGKKVLERNVKEERLDVVMNQSGVEKRAFNEDCG